MPIVELLFAGDCPNVDAARDRLQQAFAEIGEPPIWREVRIDDPAEPEASPDQDDPSEEPADAATKSTD